MQTNTPSTRYIIKPKERMKLLYKRIFLSYVKKYGLTIASLWILSSLVSIVFDFYVPLLSILFIIALFFCVNIEYDLWLLTSESLVYNNNRIIKTEHGDFQVPNSFFLLAMPFIENIVKYIDDIKKHNILFKVSLGNSIQKNSKSNKKQEIVFYVCNFCTRLILDIDTRATIIHKEYLTFDLGFMSGLKYNVVIHDENGKTLDNMPKYKIDCIKETISKRILEEDIDIFCYNNGISLFDFLVSFFFVYWLVENYLLYDSSRKILV